MKAEYFPPKEDVILQNEAPTDFYILVTGAVVRIQLTHVNTKFAFRNLEGSDCNKTRYLPSSETFLVWFLML